jgi:hypothetical protein
MNKYITPSKIGALAIVVLGAFAPAFVHAESLLDRGESPNASPPGFFAGTPEQNRDIALQSWFAHRTRQVQAAASMNHDAGKPMAHPQG